MTLPQPNPQPDPGPEDAPADGSRGAAGAVRPAEVVYISSAGHSGSTLLDMSIGAHSRAFSAGELVLLPREFRYGRPCTCGLSTAQCPVWRSVLGRHLDVGGDALEARAASLNLGWMPPDMQGEDTPPDYQRGRTLSHLLRYAELRAGSRGLRLSGARYRDGLATTLRLYDDVRAVTGASLIVNSTKHYLMAVDHVLALSEGARVIDLVRDGRAVFASFLRHGFDRPSAVKAWTAHYRRAHALFSRHLLPHQRLRVRYEDFTADPRATLTVIGAFIGLPFEERQLDLRGTVHHNVNGNDARFRKKPVSQADERWRQELTAEDLAYFEREAGELNRAFGYGG